MCRLLMRAMVLSVSLLAETSATAAHEIQTHITNAQHAYEESEYTTALQLLSMCPKDSTVWFNMGQCYAQQEKFPEAISCFYAARHGASSYVCELIADRLKALGQQLHISLEIPHTSYMQKVIRIMWSWIPLVYAQFVLLLFWLLILIGFVRLRRYSLYKGFCSFVACLCISLCYWFVIEYSDRAEYFGIIRRDNVSLHIVPRDGAHITDSLPAGTRVAILEDEQGWYKIRKDHYLLGWVPAVDVIQHQKLSVIG